MIQHLGLTKLDCRNSRTRAARIILAMILTLAESPCGDGYCRSCYAEHASINDGDGYCRTDYAEHASINGGDGYCRTGYAEHASINGGVVTIQAEVLNYFLRQNLKSSFVACL